MFWMDEKRRFIRPNRETWLDSDREEFKTLFETTASLLD